MEAQLGLIDDNDYVDLCNISSIEYDHKSKVTMEAQLGLIDAHCHI